MGQPLKVQLWKFWVELWQLTKFWVELRQLTKAWEPPLAFQETRSARKREQEVWSNIWVSEVRMNPDLDRYPLRQFGKQSRWGARVDNIGSQLETVSNSQLLWLSYTRLQG